MKASVRASALILCLALIAVVFVSCKSSLKDRFRAQITHLFLSNEKAFDEAAREILEQGRKDGKEIRTFHIQINDAEYVVSYQNVRSDNGDPFRNEHVSFSMGGFGLAPSSVNYSLYYSPSDLPFGANLTRLSDSPDSSSQTKYGYGWEWKEEKGDNHGYTERICENWFYSEAHF